MRRNIPQMLTGLNFKFQILTVRYFASDYLTAKQGQKGSEKSQESAAVKTMIMKSD